MLLASNVCAISYRMACADCSKRIVRIGGGESRVDTIHPPGGHLKGSLYCNHDGFLYYE